MTATRFAEFASIIEGVNDRAFGPGCEPDRRLLLAEEGDLSIYYAPFDHVNREARIVLLGITPGRQQMDLALREARDQLRRGATLAEAAVAAKRHASFGGQMRSNLIRILDHSGIPPLIGAESASVLFEDARLAHFTSCIRYPAFRRGENYNGWPNMIRTPLLRRYVVELLMPELAEVAGALVLPLGPKPLAALQFLTAEGVFDSARIVDGLPHPSGANNGPISRFLGHTARAVKKTAAVQPPSSHISSPAGIRIPASSALADTIRSVLQQHPALTAHPAGHSKYLDRYRTKLARGVAHEHRGSRAQHLWVALDGLALDRLADIAHEHYSAVEVSGGSDDGVRRYGRISGLKAMPELATCEVVRFSPKTVDEARRVVDAAVAMSTSSASA